MKTIADKLAQNEDALNQFINDSKSEPLKEYLAVNLLTKLFDDLRLVEIDALFENGKIGKISNDAAYTFLTVAHKSRTLQEYIFSKKISMELTYEHGAKTIRLLKSSNKALLDFLVHENIIQVKPEYVFHLVEEIKDNTEYLDLFISRKILTPFNETNSSRVLKKIITDNNEELYRYFSEKKFFSVLSGRAACEVFLCSKKLSPLLALQIQKGCILPLTGEWATKVMVHCIENQFQAVITLLLEKNLIKGINKDDAEFILRKSLENSNIVVIKFLVAKKYLVTVSEDSIHSFRFLHKQYMNEITQLFLKEKLIGLAKAQVISQQKRN